MNDKERVIGIDVSKVKLNCYCTKTGEGVEIANTEKAIETYLHGFEKENLLVLYESTGVYSSQLLKVCNEKKVKHYQIHPTQFAQTCRGMGKTNKNDPLDARAIAEIGYLMLNHMGNLTLPSSNNIKVLMSYLSSIDSLKRMQKRYRNLIDKTKSDAFNESDVIEFYEEHLEDLESKIRVYMEEVENKLKEIGYEEKLNNLQTIPGIGKQVAIYLILFFIDLASKGIGQEDTRKVSAYSGLNPIEEQSGSSLQRSKISKKGRSVVREVLYMPSMNRYKFTSEENTNKEKYSNTTMGRFFLRMRTKFESPKSKRGNSVIVAMMKKTLLVARGIFRNDTQYNRS